MFSCLNLSYAFATSSPSCSMSSCFFYVDKTPTISVHVSAVNCLDYNFRALLLSITSPLLLIPNALRLKIERCCEVASLSAHLVGVSLCSAANGLVIMVLWSLETKLCWHLLSSILQDEVFILIPMYTYMLSKR